MKLRKLTYLVPILIIAPLDLGARPPVQKGARPAPGPDGSMTVKGITLTARIVSKPGRPVMVAINGHNPLPRPAVARVKIQVMEQPSSPPMARMVPMPRERASHTLEVALGPGERLNKTVPFPKVKQPKRKKLSKNRVSRSTGRLFAQVLMLKKATPAKPQARAGL